MSEKNVIVCDFCPTQKRETNNWYRVALVAGDNHASVRLVISHEPIGRFDKDACGEKCVGTAVSRFLDHGTLEER